MIQVRTGFFGTVGFALLSLLAGCGLDSSKSAVGSAKGPSSVSSKDRIPTVSPSPSPNSQSQQSSNSSAQTLSTSPAATVVPTPPPNSVPVTVSIVPTQVLPPLLPTPPAIIVLVPIPQIEITSPPRFVSVIGSIGDFAWVPVSGAIHYRVILSSDNACSAVVRKGEGLLRPRVQFFGLNVGSYFLCVSAMASDGRLLAEKRGRAISVRTSGWVAIESIPKLSHERVSSVQWTGNLVQTTFANKLVAVTEGSSSGVYTKHFFELDLDSAVPQWKEIANSPYPVTNGNNATESHCVFDSPYAPYIRTKCLDFKMRYPVAGASACIQSGSSSRTAGGFSPYTLRYFLDLLQQTMIVGQLNVTQVPIPVTMVGAPRARTGAVHTWFGSAVFVAGGSTTIDGNVSVDPCTSAAEWMQLGDAYLYFP